jgi:hypothetical protein
VNAHGQSENCNFTKRLNNYQSKVNIIWSENGVRLDTSTFNLIDYMNIFDKLSLKECYNLGMLYARFDFDAFPLIYAFPDTFSVDREIYKSIIKNKVFLDSILEIQLEELKECNDIWIEKKILRTINARENIDSENTFYHILNKDSLSKAYFHLEPEETREGYFQYLVFYLSGESFGLTGFYNLGFKKIICSNQDLELIIKLSESIPEYNFNKEEAYQLFKLDLNPTIEIYNNACFITLVEFNRYGFFRIKYKIDLATSIKIIAISKEMLLKNSIDFFY